MYVQSEVLTVCGIMIVQVPALCAKELFRTARDMLDLFRAVRMYISWIMTSVLFGCCTCSVRALLQLEKKYF